MTLPPESGSDDVVFLFKRGRRERLEAGGDWPSEFFYGYVEMKNAGAPVDLLDEAAFGIGARTAPVWTALTIISSALFGLNAWAIHRLSKGLDRLSQAREVVVVNNAYGLALAYLKARGRLPGGVVFIAMGLVGAAPPLLVRWVYGRILRHVTVAVISRAEREHLAALFSDIKVHYVPFGVDHRFWTPGEGQDKGDYVLSVGNDKNRDFHTLIRAWRPEFPTLRIVTQRAVPATLPANVEVIAGDWRAQVLSDGELRDMVRGSRFVVVPSRDTMQPAGQSACLQAMACGKAVVLSDIAGLWDRGLMRHGENCILVKPGDAGALGRAVQGLLDDPEVARDIGQAARRTVEDHLNVDVMARAVRALCFENQANAV